MTTPEKPISRAEVILALGVRKPSEADLVGPLGGRPVTPEQERETGEMLRRELAELQDPIVERRSRVMEAFAGAQPARRQETTKPR